MRRAGLLEVMRCGRASFAAVTLYFFLLPTLIGLLPRPAPTAEFLLLRDLATAEICSTPGAGPVQGQPWPHQPDCIPCSTVCSHACASAAPPSAHVAAERFFVGLALAETQPDELNLPGSRLFDSDLQSRGPPPTA